MNKRRWSNLTWGDVLGELDLVLVIIVKCNIYRIYFELVYAFGRARVCAIIFSLFSNLVETFKSDEADHRAADRHITSSMTNSTWCGSALAELLVYKIDRVLRAEGKIMSIIMAIFLTATLFSF